jgi:hypothetical protein
LVLGIVAFCSSFYNSKPCNDEPKEKG